jgi:hypothetical protein
LTRQTRSTSLSDQLKRLSGQPTKYRVGVSVENDGNENTVCFDCRLAGWILVRKMSVTGEETSWKRRYIEVDSGEARLYITDSPSNISIDAVHDVEFHVRASATDCVLHVTCGSKDLLHVRAARSVIHALTDRLLDLPDKDKLHRDVLTSVTVMPKQTPSVLLWSGRSVSVCPRRLKRTFELHSLTLATNTDVVGMSECHHQLIVTNGGGETLALTAPDPMVLLQWYDGVFEVLVFCVSISSFSLVLGLVLLELVIHNRV